jgi:clan AA aspartic protease (TIGR02281 family)
MERKGGVFYIPCKVNKIPLSFVFDTGASTVTISLTEASFMFKNGYLTEVDIITTENYFDANGDLNEGIVINLKELEIQGLKIENVKATIIKNTNAPLLLGQSVLSRLGVLQLDFLNGTLLITSSKKNLRSEGIISGKKVQTHNNSLPYLVEIRNYSEEIQKNRNNSNAYLNRGITYLNSYNINNIQHHLDSALNDFNYCLFLNPNECRALYERGDCLQRLNKSNISINDFIDAERCYSESIFKNKNDLDNYFRRGVVRFSQKKYYEAITDFTVSIEGNWNSKAYSYMWRANCYKMLGQVSSACNDYNQVALINSSNDNTYSKYDMNILISSKKECGCK